MRAPDSFRAQPIRAAQTMLRTIASLDPDMPSVIPDGIYGKNTLAAVTAFQRREQLPATGVINLDTWDAIVAAHNEAMISVGPVEPLNIILQPEQTMDAQNPCLHIYMIQGMVTALSKRYANIPPLTVTGEYDDATIQAIRAIQNCAHLPETDCVNRATWQLLARLYRLAIGDGSLPQRTCAEKTPEPPAKPVPKETVPKKRESAAPAES